MLMLKGCSRTWNRDWKWVRNRGANEGLGEPNSEPKVGSPNGGFPVLLMEPVGPLNRAAVALNSNRLGGLFGCYIEPTDPAEFLLEIPRSRMENSYGKFQRL